jgi:hypothetical protein
MRKKAGVRRKSALFSPEREVLKRFVMMRRFAGKS